MFRANPSVQNSSLIKQFQCDQPTMSWNSTQLYSILLCSTLLYSTLLYPTLLYSTLLTSGKCQLGLKTSELLLYRRNMPTGLEIQNISYKFILLTVFFYDVFLWIVMIFRIWFEKMVKNGNEFWWCFFMIFLLCF